MELDEVKRIIQDFFQENTVTIIGSGLSLAEGIPGMSALATELMSRMPSLLSDPSDADIWSKIATNMNSGTGLEQALHDIKPTPAIEEHIRKITAQYIGNAEADVLSDIVKNNKELRFSKYLNHFNIRNNNFVVITTNYDRLIEYACEINGIRVDNLFVGKFLARFDPEHSKYLFCKNIVKRGGKTVAEFAPRVTVFKPHGCLSWHMVDGIPFSLTQSCFDDALIITPGINKYKEGYNAPFDTHRAKANAAIDSAQRYIIIGYGFGDDHLETHLVRQLKNGKPALILTHSLSEKTRDLISTCRNIIGICSKDTDNSAVVTQSGETIFSNLNLWDLNEMLKEVF